VSGQAVCNILGELDAWFLAKAPQLDTLIPKRFADIGSYDDVHLAIDNASLLIRTCAGAAPIYSHSLQAFIYVCMHHRNTIMCVYLYCLSCRVYVNFLQGSSQEKAIIQYMTRPSHTCEIDPLKPSMSPLCLQPHDHDMSHGFSAFLCLIDLLKLHAAEALTHRMKPQNQPLRMRRYAYGSKVCCPGTKMKGNLWHARSLQPRHVHT
jgi:hypothetical protein